MSNNRYLHLFILFVLGLIVYSATFGGPFVYDDTLFILENEQVMSLSNFLYPSGTRFVGFLSFALNYALGGYDPFGYKAAGILIHIINSMLVYSLASLMLETPVLEKEKRAFGALPLISALLFLVHPIETQAVSYVTQRFATLATLFFLISLTFYMRSRLAGLLARSGEGMGGRRYLFYAIALISAVVAQKTKEISFTLPFVICLFEFTLFYSHGKDESVKRRIVGLIPFILTMVIIPVTLYLPDTGHGGALGVAGWLSSHQLQDTQTISRFDYLMTQFRVIVTYLRLLFLPYNQNLLYDYPFFNSFFAPPVFISFLFLALIISTSIYLYLRSIKRRSVAGTLVSLGVLWFFVTISVESSVIPILHVIFEHRLYLPSAGLFIAVSAGFIYLAQVVSKMRADGEEGAIAPALSKGAWGVVLAAILILSILSLRRNDVWSSEIRLWEDVAGKSPNLSMAHNNLAISYSNAEDRSAALEHYKRALTLNSNNPKAHNNIAKIYSEDGSFELALSHSLEALRLSPTDPKFQSNIALLYLKNEEYEKALYHIKEAIRLYPGNSRFTQNLADIYFKMGVSGDALAQYKEALKQNPNNARTHNNIANLYSELGDISSALGHYKEAIRLESDRDEIFFNLAGALNKNGQRERALKNYSEAIRLAPKKASYYLAIGVLYKEMGEGKKAETNYKEALRLNPGLESAYSNLASLYFSKGIYDEAVNYFNRALQIDPANDSTHYNLAATYRAMGKAALSKKHYRESIRLNSHSADAHYYLGLSYLEEQKNNEAKQEFNEALRISPDFKQASTALENMETGKGLER